MNQKPKRKKAGRPPLPKGQAKGHIVPIRFNAESFRAIAVAAKKNKQTVSEWLRSTAEAASRQT